MRRNIFWTGYSLMFVYIAYIALRKVYASLNGSDLPRVDILDLGKPAIRAINKALNADRQLSASSVLLALFVFSLAAIYLCYKKVEGVCSSVRRIHSELVRPEEVKTLDSEKCDLESYITCSGSKKGVVTHFEYAVLSTMAYCTEAEHDPALVDERMYESLAWNSLSKAGWKIYNFENKSESGYQAYAYIHEERELVVIAHRGTDELKDLATNLEGIISNTDTNQEYDAVKFMNATIRKLEEEGKSIWSQGVRMSFTGHSLGAWLATKTALHLQHAGYKTEVVTFDSPGAAPLLSRELCKYGEVHTDAGLSELVVINYLSHPNPVNTCNTQYGQNFRIYPNIKIRNVGDKTNYSMIVEWLARALDRHRMVPSLRVFDPCSGTAKYSRKVSRWPSGGAKAIRLIEEAFGVRINTLLKLNPRAIMKKMVRKPSVNKDIFGFLKTCGTIFSTYNSANRIYREIEKLPCFIYFKLALKHNLSEREEIADVIKGEEATELEYHGEYMLQKSVEHSEMMSVGR